MPTLNDVLAGSLAQAVQVQQVIDALKGTPNKGVPIAMVSLNDPNNYALTVQNDDPTNSRALSVLKADGTVLITADANGVTLGAPLNVPANSISGSQLANASVTNAKLGTDTARANLLTNGGFEIWQRGNGPFTSGYGPDRWLLSVTGGDTLSVSRDSVNMDVGSALCAAVTYTFSAGTGFTQLTQQLKKADVYGLAGRTITLSVRAQTLTPNSVRIALTSDGTGAPLVYSAYHSGGSTWQTLSATITVPTNFTSLSVLILWGNVSSTVVLDNAMLVTGSVAADYAPLHPADDLARCLRYYEVIGEGPASGWVMAGSVATAAAQAIWLTVPFKAKKAVAPTVTKNGTWVVGNCGQPSVWQSSFNDTVLLSSSVAAGAANYYADAAGKSLTIEGNP